MIHLGKGAAVILDAEGADGWAPTPGGITFHFKESASVFISEEMAERIALTFRHQKEKESGIIVPLQTKKEKS